MLRVTISESQHETQVWDSGAQEPPDSKGIKKPFVP